MRAGSFRLKIVTLGALLALPAVDAASAAQRSPAGGFGSGSTRGQAGQPAWLGGRSSSAAARSIYRPSPAGRPGSSLGVGAGTLGDPEGFARGGPPRNGLRAYGYGGGFGEGFFAGPYFAGGGGYPLPRDEFNGTPTRPARAGIAPSPVQPPAIYVVGREDGAPVGGARRPGAAETGSRVAAAGPRIIRVPVPR